MLQLLVCYMTIFLNLATGTSTAASIFVRSILKLWKNVSRLICPLRHSQITCGFIFSLLRWPPCFWFSISILMAVASYGRAVSLSFDVAAPVALNRQSLRTALRPNTPLILKRQSFQCLTNWLILFERFAHSRCVHFPAIPPSTPGLIQPLSHISPPLFSLTLSVRSYVLKQKK